MEFSSSRRRMLAVLAGIAAAPGLALAQSRKGKPQECSASATMGNWKAGAIPGAGWVESRQADLKLGKGVKAKPQSFLKVKTRTGQSSLFDIAFDVSREPKSANFDISMAPAGNEAAAISVREQIGYTERDRDGTYSIFLEANKFFRAPGHPMSQDGMVVIKVSHEGELLVTYTVEADGFADALRYAEREAGRLEKLKAAGRCEKKKDDCFFTTACCDYVGLPDDCFELTQLRRFRDLWLAKQPGGPEAIARYYQTAPLVLAALYREGGIASLGGYYVWHILPCALTARLGWFALTNVIYRDLIYRLERRTGQS